MLRIAGVVLAALSLAGCRSLAHSFERETVTEKTELSREVLGEEWEERDAVRLGSDKDPRGLVIAGDVHETGKRRFRVTAQEVEVTRCARRAVGGIFEAPDSPLAVADDVWIGAAFLGFFLLTHDDSDDWRVTAVLFVLSVAPFVVDTVCFIPWWIAGHDWSGECDYVTEENDKGVVTEEIDEPAERWSPAAGAAIAVSRKSRSGSESLKAIALGADGKRLLTWRELIGMTKGRAGDLELTLADGAASDTLGVHPAGVFARIGGGKVDWAAFHSDKAPQLDATARLEGSTLQVKIKNSGDGDAWQVALVVASADPAADGLAAAIGRVRPGETVEARIELPPGVTEGALDFSEAFDRAPAALPFTN